MTEQLRPYTPSEKGRELIALLFPLSHSDREKSIVIYWNQYPQEEQAILDGFHYLIQEVMEARAAGINEDTITLSGGILPVIVHQMLREKNYFSYDSYDQFFQVVNSASPSVLGNYAEIEKIIKEATKPKATQAATSGLPEVYDDAVEKKLKSICLAAQQAYYEISRIHRSLMNSQKIMDSYKADKTKISLVEFKLAQETFLDSKKIFLEQGKIIVAGMSFIYSAYQQYQDEILVKKTYIKYLAILLGSREARNPPEAYILKKAEGEFDFNLPDFEPTDLQLQHGKTKYSLKKAYVKELTKDIHRLEARYRKRKLMAMLKTEASKAKVIGELQEILKLDPSDIKTHIFIAKLMADYAVSLPNHRKRGLLREQALRHCQAAFSKIDDYLDLQEITKMKERDITRAGFVKTISAIRIPLIRNR